MTSARRTMPIGVVTFSPSRGACFMPMSCENAQYTELGMEVNMSSSTPLKRTPATNATHEMKSMSTMMDLPLVTITAPSTCKICTYRPVLRMRRILAMRITRRIEAEPMVCSRPTIIVIHHGMMERRSMMFEGVKRNFITRPNFVSVSFSVKSLECGSGTAWLSSRSWSKSSMRTKGQQTSFAKYSALKTTRQTSCNVVPHGEPGG
mmetsp:Transcript_36365/g.103465  ORF Transcript_36365/g.103465 Transcript_36365/m.103465 type:complete len:206 (+) Transcript_36365:456-1073(+)